MLREERHQTIIDLLKKHGKVIAAELSARLNVSEDTVRRDLRDMDAQGMLHRVHGGALPVSSPKLRFDDRQSYADEAKERLARAALPLIESGKVILLDGGTAALKLAELIPHDVQATIVTNSPPIAVALAAHPHIDVVMLGGQLFKNSLVNIGAATVQALETIRADICFLGVYSLHPEYGISLPDYEEVFVKRQMIANSSEVAALVTAEKLGTSSSYVVAPADAMTYLITDNGVNADTLQLYRNKGVTILQPDP